MITYLDGVSEADYAEAATRVITTPRWEGKVMSGADYFMEHAVPNFFFHVTPRVRDSPPQRRPRRQARLPRRPDPPRSLNAQGGTVNLTTVRHGSSRRSGAALVSSGTGYCIPFNEGTRS